MTQREKLVPGNLSLSLLEGPTGSDAAQLDCENRTVIKRFFTWKFGLKNVGKTTCRFLGLAGCHFGN